MLIPGTLTEVVTKLVESAPAVPIQFLDVKPLTDFVQDFLCANVSSEIYANHKQRMDKKLCHQASKTPWPFLYFCPPHILIPKLKLYGKKSLALNAHIWVV